MVRKLQRGHGYRDMAFYEATQGEKVLSSRERFLMGLEAMQQLSQEQRIALDQEWANYFLVRGTVAERSGRHAEARRIYWQAIKRASLRLRVYTRWVRALRTWV